MQPDVTAEELAEWIGASERTVRELAGRGIVVRTSRGKYRLRESVATYLSHLREIAAGRGSATGPGCLDLVAERARLASEQADMVAMRNDLTRGSVVLVADACAEFGKQCAIIRNRLRAIPSETASEIHRLKTPMEVQVVLADRIDEALTELTVDRTDEAVQR